MSHLMSLVKEYEIVKRDDLNTRAVLVLEMIENIITYPPLVHFTSKDISKVNELVQSLVTDLEENKQSLLGLRILKTWKKREHLLQIAKNLHRIKKDFMDNIEYHEEIKWLRDERKKLAIKQHKK